MRGPAVWQTWQTDRKARLPDDWPLRRLRVLRRDGYRCQHRDTPGAPRCEAPANQVDHKVAGDDHDYANLQALCRRHHALKSSAEGVEARRSRRQVDPEPHPGLMRPAL